jgi:NAD(P)-dependent dehydrogenase (short-subunit alcohol dehydrogenase family)
VRPAVWHAARMTGQEKGTAVVTGAAGGLGRAIGRLLHAGGYHVVWADTDGAGVGAEAAATGGTARRLDVRDEAACQDLAREAAGHPGGLAVWVNNAGVLDTGPAWNQDPPTRRRMMEVNALGAMHGTLAALEPMRAAGRGHVVNIVSLAGLVAAPGETVYSASKHALLAFSVGTLADLRAAGITGVHVSCLCPDGIWTPMLHGRLDDPGAAASFTGTLLTPERVAARVGRLLRSPRPVVALPRWRGGQVRLLAAFPRLGLRLLPVVTALGRSGQRRQARRGGA